jgi:hypothetical protein
MDIKERKQFRLLGIGDKFDFINSSNPYATSFFQVCTKISARKYRDESGVEHKIGSIKCPVNV